jgi:hypothetical protein
MAVFSLVDAGRDLNIEVSADYRKHNATCTSGTVRSAPPLQRAPEVWLALQERRKNEIMLAPTPNLGLNVGGCSSWPARSWPVPAAVTNGAFDSSPVVE